MHTSLDGGRPEGAPEGHVEVLIEKGFLLLGSIEFQIDEHLMSHGTRIDPETRFFMAQVRDAVGDAAARLLDEARNRIEAAPADGARKSFVREADLAEPAAAPPARASREVICPPRSPGVVRRRRRPGMRGIALNVGLGTAAAALCAALLLSRAVPDSAPSDADALAADTPVAVETQRVPDASEDRPGADDRPLRPDALQTAKARATGAESRAKIAAAPETVDRSDGTLTKAVVAPAASLALQLQGSGLVAYPDPRAEPEQARAAAPKETAEAALALSRAARLEVQRRLAVADFDPDLVDGIFGPATRTALGAWQKAAGLPQTGYLDGPALGLLRHQTEGDYRLWKARQARAARRQSSTVLTSPLPPASPMRPDECRRGAAGTIVYGRGVRCDFRGLRENIARFLG